MDRTGSREAVLAGSTKGLIHIGMGIQSVLGLLWLISNLGKLQEFEDSFRFLRWCEERGYGAIGSRGGIVIIQLVWLALAATAAYLLVTAYFPKERTADRLFKAISFVTIPIVLPLHLSLLPLSPLLSVSMIVWAMLRRRVKDKVWWQWGTIWLILFLIGAGAVAPGLGGKRSFPEIVADRTLWPYMSVYYDRWPDQVRDLISKDDAMGIDRLAEGVTSRLSPVLEAGLGSRRTGELYLEMSRLALEYRTREIGARVLLDGLAYTFPPLGVQEQLAGRGYETYTGRNYEIIKEHSPLLTKYAVEYGGWWFGVCMILTVFACFWGRAYRGRISTSTKTVFVCTGAMILILILRGAGCMDFKDTGWIMTVWYLIFWKIWERTRWE